MSIDGGGMVEWHIPLDNISAVDSVTGLLTRAEAEQAARRLFALMVRMKSSFAVLMADIDHFKQVNDQYGHLAGDKVLERVSQLISLELRESDVLGRWRWSFSYRYLISTVRRRFQWLNECLMSSERTVFPQTPRT